MSNRGALILSVSLGALAALFLGNSFWLRITFHTGLGHPFYTVALLAGVILGLVVSPILLSAAARHLYFLWSIVSFLVFQVGIRMPLIIGQTIFERKFPPHVIPNGDDVWSWYMVFDSWPSWTTVMVELCVVALLSGVVSLPRYIIRRRRALMLASLQANAGVLEDAWPPAPKESDT